MMRLGDMDRFFSENDAIAQARLATVRGSSPRDAGAFMFVAENDTLGTIGGGQLEYMVIDEARAMLARGLEQAEMDIPLGPEIGQCCGGRVTLSLTRMGTKDCVQARQDKISSDAAQPHVYVLGAGHVGRALASCFERLPVRCILVDGRAEELARSTALVEQRLTVLPEAEVRGAPAQSAFIVLTHDHALDFLLTAEALAREDAAYVGMIGSATKRAGFVSWLRSEMPGTGCDALICPMGAQGSNDKRPEVIASFITAEVMTALTTAPVKPPDKVSNRQVRVPVR